MCNFSLPVNREFRPVPSLLQSLARLGLRGFPEFAETTCDPASSMASSIPGIHDAGLQRLQKGAELVGEHLGTVMMHDMTAL